jgi:hypothetical protein
MFCGGISVRQESVIMRSSTIDLLKVGFIALLIVSACAANAIPMLPAPPQVAAVIPMLPAPPRVA